MKDPAAPFEGVEILGRIPPITNRHDQRRRRLRWAVLLLGFAVTALALLAVLASRIRH